MMFDPTAPLSLSSIDDVDLLNVPPDESSLTAILAPTQFTGGMADSSYQILENGLQATDLQTALPGESWEAFADPSMMFMTSLNTLSGADLDGADEDTTLSFQSASADVLLGTVGSASPLLTSVDDFAASTGTTGTVAIGGSRTGVVEASGDRDWFRVSLMAGVSYRFNLNGNTLPDTTLFLRDAAGTEITFNDDSNNSLNSEILYTASSSGTYYLDAGGFSSNAGSYTVLATAIDDFAGNTSTPGFISMGSSRTGVVETSSDRDWFRVSLAAGRRYRFNLNGNTLSDPTLALHNASGTQLAFNDDSNGGRNSELTYIPTATGTYYLNAGAFGANVGSYTVLATFDDFSANASTTGSVSMGGGRTGIVESSGDRDWFRVSLTAGRSYRFNLNGNSLGDPTLALRDAGGNQLAYNDDANGGLNSQIAYTATSTGTYYLDAGAFGSGTGSYTLLAVDTTPADDFAGNTATTGTVAIGSGRTGIVNFNGDRDWFRVSLTAGRSYRFNLNGNTLSDPTLYLRNASGTQLAYNDDANGGLNSQIAYTAASTGNYYLDAGAFSSGTGSYTLLAVDTTPADDFAGNTATTGTVAIGGGRAGVVNFSRDRDWFRVSLTAGSTYRFNLNGNTLSDPTLALRNAAGTQIAYNDDFNGLNSQITYTATSTGTYYLDAGAYSSGTGSYTVAAALVNGPTPVTDDFAANTTTTGSVAIGGSRAGVVNFSNDRDWFRVALTAGSTYRFNLNGNTLSDPTLTLRNGAGTQLAFNDDFNGLNAQITYTATATGTYYLDAGAFGSGTGSYNLLASLVNTPVPTTDDFAGNTTTTGALAVGGNRTGAVNANGDRDWFRISLTAGRTYRFTVDAGSLIDPDLYLRGSSGNQLVYSDDSGGSLNPIITFVCSTTGTYYLDVGSANNVGVGTYTLRAADLLPNDDFAANTSTTGSLAVGGSRAGAVNFNGDRDWFRVALTAGQSYRFNLNGNTLSDPTLYLRDASGSQLAFNDDFSNSFNSQITYTAATTGTYYLDAGAYSSGTGSYTLLAAVSAAPSNDDYAADTSTTGTVAVGQQASGAVEFVGDRDWFRVSLTAGRTYRFNLNGNTLSNPTLSLWNSAGSTVLATNDNFGGGLNSQITFTANATGTYFLDAAAAASLMGTYNLAATDVTPNNPDRIPGLQDTSIRSLVNTALGDNLFTHQELSSLLRSTATNGVTATEFADLGRISANLSPYLSSNSRSYTQYVFNGVVGGNTANQWWTGGGGTRVALGNLAAGSTQQHLNRLVDKWFGGLDLPTNFVGGDSAAGASSLTFSYGQMTGSLFVNGISFSDVNQGQAGTCYFLAAASSLANNQSQFIQNMFLDNGDGTYGVRFYGSSGNEIWVTVNRAVPVVGGSLALAGNATGSLSGEMWVALAEKAYAQANEIGQFGRSVTANSYRLIEGGWEDALRHISNQPTTTFSSFYTDSNWTSAMNNLSTWNSYLNTVIAAINEGRSLWLGSFGNTYDSSGKLNLVSRHAFAITGYNSSTQRFTIANPWGAGNSRYAGVFEATWAQLFNVRGVVAWA